MVPGARLPAAAARISGVAQTGTLGRGAAIGTNVISSCFDADAKKQQEQACEQIFHVLAVQFQRIVQTDKSGRSRDPSRGSNEKLSKI